MSKKVKPKNKQHWQIVCVLILIKRYSSVYFSYYGTFGFWIICMDYSMTGQISNLVCKKCANICSIKRKAIQKM